MCNVGTQNFYFWTYYPKYFSTKDKPFLNSAHGLYFIPIFNSEFSIVSTELETGYIKLLKETGIGGNEFVYWLKSMHQLILTLNGQ